jgi:hypothetical protein
MSEASASTGFGRACMDLLEFMGPERWLPMQFAGDLRDISCIDVRFCVSQATTWEAMRVTWRWRELRELRFTADHPLLAK